MGKELLIVIPAYNEEENIGNLLESLESYGTREFADILVVNDASADETGRIALAHGVQVVNLVFHMGYGNALKTGYRYALRNRYSYVIQMDADGQHDASNVRPIYERLRTGDDGKEPERKRVYVVIASRFMEGSREYKISLARKAAFCFYRSLIRLSCGRLIHDPTSGMQGLSGRAFHYFSEYRHFDDKYPDANIVLEMLLLGFSVEEIPAVMHERTHGRGLHDGFEPVYYMFRMTLSVLLTMLRGKAPGRFPDAGGKRKR